MAAAAFVWGTAQPHAASASADSMDSVGSRVVKHAGFESINAKAHFRDGVQKKGRLLHQSHHVPQVREERTATSCTVIAKCVRQTSVRKKPYDVKIQLSRDRDISSAYCTCKAGVRGDCKHVAAVVAYINDEQSLTKTSCPNGWKAPLGGQTKLYTKGVPLSTMFPPKTDIQLETFQIPPEVATLNCPLGEMLRAQRNISDNLALLEHVLPRIGTPSPVFCASECVLDALGDFSAIMMDEDECNSVAAQTIQQSACPLWYAVRQVRLSASSQAYRIRIRLADFEALAKDLAQRKRFSSKACAYGIKQEPIARKEYEVAHKCTVIRVGVLVCKVQPWLCCSPDGIVEDKSGIRLLEIKAPLRCIDKPVIDESGNINLDYLTLRAGKVELKESHIYYTQVQVCMYILNAAVCDLFVYSPVKSVTVPVAKNDQFLQSMIPKMEWFYFCYFMKELAI